MGVGPVAGQAPAAIRDAPQLAISSAVSREAQSLKGGPPLFDRKAALLEKERRFREAEERQQEMEAFEEQQRREKKAKASGKVGIQRLGPVMPREDDIPQFLPAPMQVPPPAKSETKMEIKISKETAERAKGVSAEAAKEKLEEAEDDESDAEDQVLAFLRMEKAKTAMEKEEQKPKPAKKKRKRTRGGGGAGEYG